MIAKRWSIPLVALGALALGCDEDTPPLGPSDAGATASDAGDCVQVLGYTDVDRDGFGDEAEPRTWCEGERPDDVALEAGDCNPSCDACYPGAPERCDGLDGDCDGTIDERVEVREYHRDADGDGFGAPDATVEDCAPPEGYVVDAGDCADDAAGVNPDATETCDVVDDDCDGAIDEGTLALATDPTSLGALDSDVRSVTVARAREAGGYVTVWVDDLRTLKARSVSAAGVPEAEAWTLASLPTDVPALPKATLIEGVAGARLFVSWRDDEGVWIRAVDPASGSLEPTLQLGAAANARPVELLELDDAVVAIWTTEDAAWARRLDRADGTPLGEATRLADADTAPTDALGASAVVLDPAGTILLGVLAFDPVDVTRDAYVHRIEIGETVTLDERPGRFELPSDAAPRSIQLVVDPARDATEPNGLAFLGWGAAPDRRTRVFRFVPSAPGALGTVEALGEPRTGMVLGASLAPGGADWWSREQEPSGRDVVRLHHQPFDVEAGTRVGDTRPIEPDARAALGGRPDGNGLLAFGGRISETDLDAELWVAAYGCAP